MKKYLFAIFAFAFFLTIKAQEISFNNLTEYISISGEVVPYVWEIGIVEETGNFPSKIIEFTNTGKEQLIISDIRASCKCLDIDNKYHPIAPGGKGYIKVFYNPIGRVGRFFKTITIESNAKQEYKIRDIGEVISVESSSEDTDNDSITGYPN